LSKLPKVSQIPKVTKGVHILLQRYNIAFIPSRNPQQFIQYAEELSQAAPSDKYRLGVESIPHVSICHFEFEGNKIEEIWNTVSALDFPELHLTFEKKRSKLYTAHPKWGGVYWVSLIPNHIVQLTEIHLEITKIIKEPLNAAFSDYDPHLTLFNSHAETACVHFNHAPQVNPPLEDAFNIALGLIDDAGQITEILFCNNESYST
jgi:hypothetical protein